MALCVAPAKTKSRAAPTVAPSHCNKFWTFGVSRGIWPASTSCAGNARDFADVRLPFAASPNFVTYQDENKSTQKSKLHWQSTLQHSDLISKLKLLPPKLGFKRTTVSTALALVYNEKVELFKLSEDVFNDWHVTIDRRLRNMLCKVYQAENKDYCTGLGHGLALAQGRQQRGP